MKSYKNIQNYRNLQEKSSQNESKIEKNSKKISKMFLKQYLTHKKLFVEKKSSTAAAVSS